jgi:hypothetical protein
MRKYHTLRRSVTWHFETHIYSDWF